MRLFGPLATKILDTLFGRRASPDAAASLIERGIALHESGRVDEATSLYRQVLAAHPRHAQALHLMGLVRHQRDEHGAALPLLDEAIAIAPSVALYHFNRGNVLLALGQRLAASDSFAMATNLNAAYAPAWFNLGKTRLALKDAQGAAAALRHAFRITPAMPGLRLELCAALLTLGDESPNDKTQYTEARSLLQKHWQTVEEPVAARLMLAYCDSQLGHWDQAQQAYRDILSGNHASDVMLKAHLNFANTCNQLGQMGEAIAHYRAALQLDPTLADTASSIAACINYDPRSTAADVLEAHRDWARRFAVGVRRARLPANINRDPDRRLRIGYVSADFRQHPVTALFAPVIERHDRRGFEVFCYYNHRGADAVTARIRAAADQWRSVAGIEHVALADMIVADRIDILVDLAGHTAHNRLQVFARKPAPVLVEWLGYFNTTGIEAIDYFISDPHSSPPQQEQWFSERLVRLPHTRFCYEPGAHMPEVNALPALAGGGVTFGCFNNLAKVNEGVLALWARLLDAVPGSRLVIQAQALDGASNRARFAALSASCGMAQDRLELRPFVLLEVAARAYHGIDIALDPFPFCGGMTSFEALWMGVPVVTRESEGVAGRQTLSMLRNLGLDRLVARDEADYLRIAIVLASDIAALAALRRDLRQRFRASPLMDYDAFTTALESEYRSMWQRWLAGNSKA